MARRHQLPDDYEPSPKGSWIKPDSDDWFEDNMSGSNVDPEILDRQSEWDNDNEKSLLEEDMTTEHFGEDNPQITEQPNQMMNVQISPLELMQRTLIDGLIQGITQEQAQRAAALQMAKILFPDTLPDHVIQYADFIFTSWPAPVYNKLEEEEK